MYASVIEFQEEDDLSTMVLAEGETYAEAEIRGQQMADILEAKVAPSVLDSPGEFPARYLCVGPVDCDAGEDVELAEASNMFDALERGREAAIRLGLVDSVYLIIHELRFPELDDGESHEQGVDYFGLAGELSDGNTGAVH